MNIKNFSKINVTNSFVRRNIISIFALYRYIYVYTVIRIYINTEIRTVEHKKKK